MNEIKITVIDSLELEITHFNKNLTEKITLLEALERYYKYTDIRIRELVIHENLSVNVSYLKILYMLCKQETIVPECISKIIGLPLENEFFELNICVPYRAKAEHSFRKEQLKDFILHISEFLTNKNITFRLIILEQDNLIPFNRGLLLNAGFLETEKEIRPKVQYYCHHNVDLFPEDSKLDYSYPGPKTVRDLYGFHDGLGGICIMNRTDFFDINGFPNDFLSWGAEDSAVKRRANRLDLKIDRTMYNEGVKEFTHVRDSSFNTINSRKINNNKTGLDNISYTVNKKHIGKIVFNETEILEYPNLVHYLIDFDFK